MIKTDDVALVLGELDRFLSSEEMANLPMDEVLKTLVAVNELKKELSMIYDAYAAKIITRMQSENATIVTLDSGIEVKCMTGAPRKKWDNEQLMSAVYDRIQQSSVDMDTGEVGLTNKELVLKLLDYVSPSYWRVKALNEIGINADMYCETGESKTSIAIFGANKEQGK